MDRTIYPSLFTSFSFTFFLSIYLSISHSLLLCVFMLFSPLPLFHLRLHICMITSPVHRNIFSAASTSYFSNNR